MRWPAALLALLLAAVAAGAWLAAPGRPPAPGEATTLWLAASSLARDGDLAFGAADGGRFRAAFGDEPAGVWQSRDGRLAAPALPALAAAAGAWISPARGPFLAQALLLALAAAALVAALRPRLGARAPLWVAVLLFGSVAFRAGLRLAPETLAAAGVALAYALVWGRRAGSATAPADLFEGELPAHPRLVRWLGAGVGLGCAVAQSPAYLALALPPLGALPRLRRRSAAALLAAGLVVPVAVAAAMEGAPWEPLDPRFHLPLIGWNALDFVAGRHVGLLVGFLPLVLGLLAPARDLGRRWIPAAAAVAALFLLVTSPFDWAGAAPEWGNAAFLPIYLALASRVGGPAPDSRALAVAALAGVFLLPVWLSPIAGVPPVGGAALRRALERPRALLPFETALRTLPGSVEIRRGDVALRSAGAEIFADASGERMRLAGRHGRLIVESARPLSSLRLEFGPEAPSSLRVEGGEVGNTTFRPSGEIAFDVALGAPRRRHPLWWSAAPASIYRLDLDLGQDPNAPLAFELALARSAVPAEEEP